jgi:hypothetical protein
MPREWHEVTSPDVSVTAPVKVCSSPPPTLSRLASKRCRRRLLQEEPPLAQARLTSEARASPSAHCRCPIARQACVLLWFNSLVFACQVLFHFSACDLFLCLRTPLPQTLKQDAGSCSSQLTQIE